MILLWGLLEDPTFSSVWGWLTRWNADALFVNHAAIGRSRIQFASGPRFSYQLSCGELSCALEELSAAYLRPYDHRQYEERTDQNEGSPAVSRADLVYHLMSVWAEHSSATIINRPSAEATNHSKLDQARVIRASGFLVPDSLVTNDSGLAKDFLSRHGSVIYKSMSSVRSIVKELQPSLLESIARLGPVFFQQRIMGRNIRVHVVGEKTVACLIRSDGVDYRYAQSVIEPIALPADIAGRCVALTTRLGLVLSGIDLIASGDNYYCLEVNTNPAFSYFDVSQESTIARAVAESLMQ